MEGHKPVCQDSQQHGVITYALPTLEGDDGSHVTEAYRVVTSGPGVQRVEQRNIAIPGIQQISTQTMEGVVINIRSLEHQGTR